MRFLWLAGAGGRLKDPARAVPLAEGLLWGWDDHVSTFVPGSELEPFFLVNS